MDLVVKYGNRNLCTSILRTILSRNITLCTSLCGLFAKCNGKVNVIRDWLVGYG
jgi:hypothetical protein